MMNSERFYQLDARVEEFSYGIEIGDGHGTIIDKLKGEIDNFQNKFNARISDLKDDSNHFYNEFNATVGLNNAFGEFNNSTLAFMEQVELYQQNYQNISNILDSVDEFKELSSLKKKVNKIRDFHVAYGDLEYAINNFDLERIPERLEKMEASYLSLNMNENGELKKLYDGIKLVLNQPYEVLLKRSIDYLMLTKYSHYGMFNVFFYDQSDKIKEHLTSIYANNQKNLPLSQFLVKEKNLFQFEKSFKEFGILFENIGFFPNIGELIFHARNALRHYILDVTDNDFIDNMEAFMDFKHTQPINNAIITRIESDISESKEDRFKAILDDKYDDKKFRFLTKVLKNFSNISENIQKILDTDTMCHMKSIFETCKLDYSTFKQLSTVNSKKIDRPITQDQIMNSYKYFCLSSLIFPNLKSLLEKYKSIINIIVDQGQLERLELEAQHKFTSLAIEDL